MGKESRDTPLLAAGSFILNGAYNLEDHEEVIRNAEMINSQSTGSLVTEMLQKQPFAQIYMILDNTRYSRSDLVQKFEKRNKRIRLLFLPSYSPNFNIIER